MLESIYSIFCHQQTARSLLISSHVLPICARCTGIYLGFFLGFVCNAVLFKKCRLPGYVLTAAALIFVIFIASALAESLGLIQLLNTMRFTMALGAGISIACMLIALMGKQKSKEDCKYPKGMFICFLVANGLILFFAFFGIRFERLMIFYKTMPLLGIISLYLVLNHGICKISLGIKKKSYYFGALLFLLTAQLLLLKMLHN